MTNIKNIALIITTCLTLLFGYLYFNRSTEKMIVEVPVKIEVPVKSRKNDFKPIDSPKPITKIVENPINVNLKKQLDSAITVIDSLKVYKNFAIKRSYNETFEDDIQTIIVNAETTGTLDNIQASYVTKPSSITVDTTVPVRIDVPYKSKLFIGGEFGVPVLSGVLTEDAVRSNARVAVGAGIDTKNYIFKGSISTDGYGAVGIYYKF